MRAQLPRQAQTQPDMMSRSRRTPGATSASPVATPAARTADARSRPHDLPLSAQLARCVEQRATLPGGRVLARRKPEEDVEGAKAPPFNAKAQAAALRKLDRAGMLGALATLTADQLVALDKVAKAARDAKSKLLHRCISFVRHGPRDPGHHTPAFVSKGKAGNTQGPQDVDGGKIEVTTDVGFTAYTVERLGFSMRYAGTDSDKTRWLQFVSREIVVEKPKQKPVWLKKKVVTQGMRGQAIAAYQLTGKNEKPSYNTDSASEKSPFIEAGGPVNRDATSMTMFDAPNPIAEYVTPNFDGAVAGTQVTSRAHFVTYLVRGMDVLHRVKTDVEWVFTDDTVPTPTMTTHPGEKVDALESRQRARLLEQYPDFDYLP